jgi:pimeloyl-ACP methyl ester carboxylesterase
MIERDERGNEMTIETKDRGGKAMKAKTLKVPGATLYYEVRGSGPVLLAIPGGPTEASIFTAFAEQLSDRYTVVTYDPRGHSRSTVDNRDEDVSVAQHADDAVALIDAVSSEPAYVLGSSGGATIGLELVVRHGDRVKALVAHEPPVMELLPDADRWRALFEELKETNRKEGVFAAFEKFGAAVEEGGPSYAEASQPSEPTPEMAQMMERISGNGEFFFEHEALPIGNYIPDTEALKASPSRIFIGGGKESGEQGAYRAAVALAEKLGIELTYFEGAHGGFGAEEAFGERVHETIQGS